MKSGSLVILSIVLLMSCDTLSLNKSSGTPGQVVDEARRANRNAASFPPADEDYFKDMDGGAALSPAEVKGRNTWIVWTGGNDKFWDDLSRRSFGTLDFLKTLSSHPNLKFSRDNRWSYLGLVNEPCFEKATGPDPSRFGLWLDKRIASPDCQADPFENEAKYPGVKTGARGRNLPVGSFYGYATGIVGLRLFPNPDFDEEAAKQWDPKRYYEDPSYYLAKNLVKPYRVGMSCAFCHVGPIPTKPPTDAEHPEWKHLSSNVGAQYFWIDRIFSWEADQTSFPYQIFRTSRPGALDTSLVSTDSINNPRTMNAVYELGARLEMAKRWGHELLDGGSLNNRQFNDYEQALRQYDKTGRTAEFANSFFKAPATVWTTRVLKDGSDSVGALGALNRVFLNIGLFSEEWLLHFKPLIGGEPITPIMIRDARNNSSYWESTEAQTPNLALFFLKTTGAHKLKDAPDGGKYMTPNAELLLHGKEVFAERCARCHSSKLPTQISGLDPHGCAGSDYLNCWNKYWQSTKTEEFKREMRKIVLADNFLENNFLSNDMRVPVTLLETNACSPLATNAIENNIWDNFSSRSYKDLPSVGTITVHHPITGEARSYQMPAGGRGYTRVTSLVSLWSTAPYLLNNSVGRFNPSPSVDARMTSFQSSIEQMLWPEKRDNDPILGNKVPGVIDRTTATSYLRIPKGFLPDFLQDVIELEEKILPDVQVLPPIFKEAGIEVGPIPKGTPVNLLANLDMLPDDAGFFQKIAHKRKLAKLLIKVKKALKALPLNASDEEARKVFLEKDLVEPLLELSKCPDFVPNRGHYFGTDRLSKAENEPGLSEQDKRALIEFLKTF
ncbi:hypothetical protein [Nitrospira sp. KM1]|uniref:hypothetical protein n=1 Tax=Nitrospira sp. KM1 TaxID=1936990 RepID=UPI00351A5DE9